MECEVFLKHISWTFQKFLRDFICWLKAEDRMNAVSIFEAKN